MANSQKWLLTVVVTAALVALTVAQSPSPPSGSGDVPSCASKLTECAQYINATTTPPSSCCTPLKEAVTNEKECLCNLYNNTALLQAFNINITQAMNLPKLCKIDTGSPNMCKGIASSPSSPGSSQTPAGGSGSGSGSNKNAADKITRTGLVSSLLIVVAYVFFY